MSYYSKQLFSSLHGEETLQPQQMIKFALPVPGSVGTAGCWKYLFAWGT